jgi:hypothetical protein
MAPPLASLPFWSVTSLRVRKPLELETVKIRVASPPDKVTVPWILILVMTNISSTKVMLDTPLKSTTSLPLPAEQSGYVAASSFAF